MLRICPRSKLETKLRLLLQAQPGGAGFWIYNDETDQWRTNTVNHTYLLVWELKDLEATWISSVRCLCTGIIVNLLWKKQWHYFFNAPIIINIIHTCYAHIEKALVTMQT